MRVAESEDNAEGGNADDDVVEIPRDTMEVKADKVGKDEKAEDLDSEISGPRESSKSSSSSSSSGPSVPKGKAAKAKASSKEKAEPKRGRGRGRGTAIPPPKAEVPKKRPVPLDTSDVKLNMSLKARLDQISQQNAIEASGSASSSSKAPAVKRRKT